MKKLTCIVVVAGMVLNGSEVLAGPYCSHSAGGRSSGGSSGGFSRGNSSTSRMNAVRSTTNRTSAKPNFTRANSTARSKNFSQSPRQSAHKNNFAKSVPMTSRTPLSAAQENLAPSTHTGTTGTTRPPINTTRPTINTTRPTINTTRPTIGTPPVHIVRLRPILDPRPVRPPVVRTPVQPPVVALPSFPPIGNVGQGGISTLGGQDAGDDGDGDMDDGDGAGDDADDDGDAMYGMEILDMEDDGPALNGGFKLGDIILAINGMPTPDLDSLQEALAVSGPQANFDFINVETGETEQMGVELPEPRLGATVQQVEVE